MASFKNITIKKKGGGTRTQRVQVLASGKYRFVKNVKKSRKSNPRASSKPRKVKSLARRRYVRKTKRRSRQFTIPLAPTAAILGTIARPTPAGTTIIGDVMNGDIPQLLYDVREVFAGVDNDGKLRLEWLLATYGPIVAGLLIHRFIGGRPLNVNAMLARAGVPIIRI